MGSSGSSNLDFRGEFEDVTIWEIAESLGFWWRVGRNCCEGTTAAAGSSKEAPALESGELVILRCGSWHWRTSHPTAPLTLRPTDEVSAEIDSMIDASQLLLCFATRRCSRTGMRLLELQSRLQTPEEALLGASAESASSSTRHKRLRSLQAALQTLGFARTYQKGAPPSPKAPEASNK